MAVKKSGSIRIGTSNVVIPGNKQSFPEAFKTKSRLAYYSSLFNTVEINSSFYKVPMPETFVKWATETAEGFHFSIKLWKEITHVKLLNFKLPDIHLFLDAAVMAGEKRGPLLIQFPGKINVEFYNHVQELLSEIRYYTAGIDWRLAVEFRDSSWYIRETMEMLEEYDASLVLHDIPRSAVKVPLENSSFIYLRFHGIKGDYRGSYTEKQLAATAKQIKTWAKAGKDVYVYFNNSLGDAYGNARRLQELVLK